MKTGDFVVLDEILERQAKTRLLYIISGVLFFGGVVMSIFTSNWLPGISMVSGGGLYYFSQKLI